MFETPTDAQSWPKRHKIKIRILTFIALGLLLLGVAGPSFLPSKFWTTFNFYWVGALCLPCTLLGWRNVYRDRCRRPLPARVRYTRKKPGKLKKFFGKRPYNPRAPFSIIKTFVTFAFTPVLIFVLLWMLFTHGLGGFYTLALGSPFSMEGELTLQRNSGRGCKYRASGDITKYSVRSDICISKNDFIRLRDSKFFIIHGQKTALGLYIERLEIAPRKNL